MNAPADYVERLRADHAGDVVVQGRGPFDAVHLFVRDSSELNKHFKQAAPASSVRPHTGFRLQTPTK